MFFGVALQKSLCSQFANSGKMPLPTEVWGDVMKELKRKLTAMDPERPVWCDRCSVRIAPSERHTFKGGKAYHEGCFTKLQTGKAKAGRN